MSEKLKIEGFAGIKEFSIDLRKINVFIGPQATGKSVTAKLLYFFKSLLAQMYQLAGTFSKGEIKGVLRDAFEGYFPREAWGDGTFSIRFEYKEEFVVLEGSGGKTPKTRLSWSRKYDEIIDEYIQAAEASRRVSPKPIPGQAVRVKSGDSVLPRNLSALLSYQLFIPAGRSFFAVLQKNVFTMLARDVRFDPFLEAFGSFYEQSKQARISRKPGRGKSAEREINKLVSKVLGANYVLRDGGDFLKFPDGRIVDLAHVSSGQQEALPLAVILEKLIYPWPWPGNWSESKTVYVEEPEAHLFPATQRLVVELLATVFNTDPENLQFVVTTHSPYILTALNNLLQAGQLGEELADDASALKKLHRVVPKSRHLVAGDVSAYYFDGKKAKSILSRQDGLINADVIDSVSEDLAIQFDKMLDIGG